MKAIKNKPPKPVKQPAFKQKQAKNGKMTLYEKRPGSNWKAKK